MSEIPEKAIIVSQDVLRYGEDRGVVTKTFLHVENKSTYVGPASPLLRCINCVRPFCHGEMFYIVVGRNEDDSLGLRLMHENC